MKRRSRWGSNTVWASCDNPLNTAVQTHDTSRLSKAACNDGINLLDIILQTTNPSNICSVSFSQCADVGE